MRPFTVRYAGVFRDAQRLREPSPWLMFGLVVSGVRRWSQCGRADLADDVPMLIITVAGERYDVEFDQRRENWVAIVDGLALRRAADPALLEYDDAGGVVRLPWVVPLRRDEVPAWRERMRAMALGSQAGTAQGRAIAEFGVVAQLAHHVAAIAPPPRGLAARLRAEIDSDPAASLAEVFRRCGAEPHRARAEFRAAHGSTAARYRAERRVAAAVDQIVRALRPAKEVARRLGFRHLSALSRAARRELGMSLREARRRAAAGEPPRKR